MLSLGPYCDFPCITKCILIKLVLTQVPTNTNEVKQEPLPVCLILDDGFWISGEANESRMCSTSLCSHSPSPIPVYQSRSFPRGSLIKSQEFGTLIRAVNELKHKMTDAPTLLLAGLPQPPHPQHLAFVQVFFFFLSTSMIHPLLRIAAVNTAELH